MVSVYRLSSKQHNRLSKELGGLSGKLVGLSTYTQALIKMGEGGGGDRV